MGDIEYCPLVSILVPIYNVECYIERCVRSVLEQTYPHLEFVFVDDGCTDSSMAIFDKIIHEYRPFKDNTIIIHHQQNMGLAAARNTALASCHGDYLIHVDSDDWIEPDAVELLVKRQQETGADIVYTCGYYRHGTETAKSYCRNWSIDKESLLTYFLQDKATICIWSKLIKKSLYTDNGISCDEQGSYYEDFQTLARLIYYSKTIASIDQFVYHHERSNPSSIVTNIPNSIEIQRQGLRSIQVACDFFKDKEQRYLDLVLIFQVRYLKRMVNTNCRSKNRKGYFEFLTLLEKVDKKFWPLIGWNKPLNRMIDRNYYLKTLSSPLKVARQKAVSVLKAIGLK